ncbi:MAG TPA: malto-oligosyltrehalose synthase [Fibrobacteria bacterium]|nr:malto-oligosyltrehalose synthase [Fibrobacteria bacterium]
MIRIPLATYRLQMHKGFGFRAALDAIPYLHELGISDLYLSPIFKAREGSTHGYDVVDHNAVNPELGTQEDLEALAAAAKARSLGWLQDIVPNHMAYDSENRLLMDVLENGPQSRFIGFFDIEWNHHDETLKGKLLAPVLGSFFGECLENGEIALEFAERGLSIRYYSHVFPLRIESYAEVLGGNLAQLRGRLDRKHPDYVKLMGVFYILKNLPDGDESGERYDQIRFVKSMLWELRSANPTIKEWLDETLRILNGTKGDPGSFKRLSALMAQQYYRLAFWRVGVEEVNYRRFFAVNDLISLKVEDPQVFDRVHQLPLKLLEQGLVTGLRIDHIDGLYHPLRYLQRLRAKAPEAYIAVEKILADGEPLKTSWPIQGTTGYEFMNDVGRLFVQSANKEAMDAAYRRYTGMETDCGAMTNEKKRLLIEKDLYGGLENLVYQLKAIASKFPHASDFTLFGFRRALEEVFVHFPVYRTYIDEDGADERDRQVIAWTMEKARASLPSHLHELDFIEKMLLAQGNPAFTPEEKALALEFAMRLQQFTSPLMAKGIEDTFLYVYQRLVSLNEVGGNPDVFGKSAEEFHAMCRGRLSAWPHAMNATATHDTKRGEDVRARIHVLSEIPGEWEAKVAEWHAANKGLRKRPRGHFLPDRNDEYLLYQSLVGAWPFPGRGEEEFPARLRDYLVKAVREAKVHTVWLKPDREYEEGFLAFLDRLLDPVAGAAFRESFLPFQRKVAFFGVLNSLAQTLVKITSPGIPDIYQGAELWDLSLVDPDNRRPVDYALRRSLLQEIRARGEQDPRGLFREILADPSDGRCKLWLIHRALKARKASPAVFQYGEYLPLHAEGPRRENVVAFARSLGRTWYVTIVPRFCASFLPEGTMPLGEVWKGSRIRLPGEAPTRWVDAMTGAEILIEGRELELSQALGGFPAALLEGQS